MMYLKQTHVSDARRHRRTADEPPPVRGDERADGDGGLQPLLDVQVAGRLVEHEAAADDTGVKRVKGQGSKVGATSNTHMSAFWMQTTAQANLCSSPPDRSSTFLSRR